MTGLMSDSFQLRLDRLRADLIEQSRRVQAMIESAFESVFAADAALAQDVIARDDVIDRVDVEIERAAVRLLTEAAAADGSLDESQVRGLLTVVKVNNELERVADLASALAERVKNLAALGEPMPPAFRVIANSVLGILRDMTRAVERRDPALCRVVLRSEATVEAFKDQVLREAQERLARGETRLEFAFALHDLCDLCERMADHATNIAEQVIYSVTGTIVRHTEGQWRDVPLDPPSGVTG